MLGPPLRDLLADSSASVDERLLTILDPPVQALVPAFYDRPFRYANGQLESAELFACAIGRRGGPHGISDMDLSGPAKALRRLGFWRMAAELIGASGLQELHARCQAFLDIQEEIGPVFGQLYNLWLFAPPSSTCRRS